MNEFLAGVGEALAAKIAEDGIGPVASGETRHWIVVEDDTGTAVGDHDDTARAPHEILGSLIEREGTRGAAYVTQHAGDSLIAQAYLKNPSYGLSSDIRRSSLIRTSNGVAVAADWEYTL